MADCFCQVGGIWVNCMTDRASTDMYIANGIEQWIRSPKLRQEDARPEAYNVFAKHHRPSDREFLTDVFAFDAKTGSLIEAILGISYVKVPKASMSKLLTRLTARDAQIENPSPTAASEQDRMDIFSAGIIETSTPIITTLASASKAPKASAAENQTQRVDVAAKVKTILAELSGLELEDIKDDSELADLGIDSLMGMEMAHEIEAAFKITLPEDELINITHLHRLIECVHKAVSGNDAETFSEETYAEESNNHHKSENPSVFTPSDVETDVSSAIPIPETELAEGCPGVERGDLKLPVAMVLEAFNETKELMDERIAEYHQTNYVKTVMPMQTQMCIALTLDAFEQLGCLIRQATAGQKFSRISHTKEHSRLVDSLYRMLETEAKLLSIDADSITRTTTPSPSKSSTEILEDLLAQFPDQDTANRLTFYTGSNLANVLSGKTDGIKLIFGTPEGCEFVSGLYGDWPLNRLFYKQMEGFLARLIMKLDMTQGRLKILEMGAGTGGTTKWLVPLLASLNIPIEYTFTDLAPSFVAAARKTFKSYSFMSFRTHDIEKPPAEDLIGMQHVVVASNAVHATHSLSESGRNIRKALRPDGFLLMLEMTSTLYWVDLVFGLFEGWWYFDDSRTHAVTDEVRWKKDLQAVGYGHVDWTDGNLPENKVERLIIAMASSSRYEQSPIPKPLKGQPTDCKARQVVVEEYVRRLTEGFTAAFEDTASFCPQTRNPEGNFVVVTGGTGSLGSHLVASLALKSDVTEIICLNRRSQKDPHERQQHSLLKAGIVLNREALSKIRVSETDLSKPNLGLPVHECQRLFKSVTHIIHNAWLMNAKWPLKSFEPQLQIMRNMLGLAAQMSHHRHSGRKVTFQFISSIAVVGHWPLSTGKTSVPEERMTIDSVLPTGYGDAKYICELMLDETLHKYCDHFRAMTVRPGQIAGLRVNGYWNPKEHLSFLWKSSQTIGALPDFDGLLSWTLVDDVASTLVDLLFLPEESIHYPIYHIDNPVRQSWKDVLPILADAIHISTSNVIPFQEWIERIRDYPTQKEGPGGDNPAKILVDFLDENFLRMSCGGLLLDTERAREHSTTLANVGPVEGSVVRRFVEHWREVGFLR